MSDLPYTDEDRLWNDRDVQLAYHEHRKHVFADRDTCACGYRPKTSIDWDRHVLAAIIDALTPFYWRGPRWPRSTMNRTPRTPMASFFDAPVWAGVAVRLADGRTYVDAVELDGPVMLAAGAETRTVYNIRFRKANGWCVDEALNSPDPDPESEWDHTRELFGADVHQVSRTVTTWPDGSYHCGPWLPPPDHV